MTALPSGTVTFLFTDVEGSTGLLHEVGAEAYAEALAEHRRLIRDACARHGGVEVDTQGDAFFFAFPTAPGALVAAGLITDGLADGPIQVRMGVHTGMPLVTGEGYVGEDVHLAARVAASAHGGQVVLSASTAAVATPSGSEPEAPTLVDLGEHRLKDIEGAVQIFQLGDGKFPPLKTISNTNLPRPASSFVGRERELAELLARIEGGARLLTLTGPGGSGKTRLALEAATSLIPEYKAGVFWVGLASLRDPALVTETIARTLGAKDGLAEHISERELLLLVDNLEQVVEAAPELSALLAACPNLTLLVTSRELLRVQGEVEYPVPPLAETEAVSLFCERAQAEPSELIAALCTRLDNLPLAVELAAARAKALSPAQILERLSSRLDLLKGGRDADPRQQTLRATIEWSYELLSEEEQALFRRLAVFSGGCTLEAAEEVCDADLDTLQSLVEKSLLRFSDERYWMLETIREYAGGRLHACAEANVVSRRHASQVSQVVERARVGIDRGDARTLDEIASELGNIRTALSWLGDRDPAAQFDLLDAVMNFWSIRGGWNEALGWTQDYLVKARTERDARLAGALYMAAFLENLLGAPDRAESYAEESLSISRELGDPTRSARALRALAVVMVERGDYGNAERLAEESVAQAEQAGEATTAANTRVELSKIALRRGDFDRAIAAAGQSLLLFRESSDAEGVAWAQYILALALFRTERDDEARAAAAESVTISKEMRDVLGCAWNLVLLGALAARRGDAPRCARLVGAADALRERSNAILTGIDLDMRVVTEEELRREMGDERYEAAFADGQAMTLDEAVELALAS